VLSGPLLLPQVLEWRLHCQRLITSLKSILEDSCDGDLEPTTSFCESNLLDKLKAAVKEAREALLQGESGESMVVLHIHSSKHKYDILISHQTCPESKTGTAPARLYVNVNAVGFWT
jgi:hypothetical protein